MHSHEVVDSDTYVWYLEVESPKIVLLQTIFESYEGVGIVRTLSRDRGLVCILSTPSMEGVVRGVLESLHEVVPWKLVEPGDDIRSVVDEGHFSRLS